MTLTYTQADGDAILLLFGAADDGWIFGERYPKTDERKAAPGSSDDAWLPMSLASRPNVILVVVSATASARQNAR